MLAPCAFPTNLSFSPPWSFPVLVHRLFYTPHLTSTSTIWTGPHSRHMRRLISSLGSSMNGHSVIRRLSKSSRLEHITYGRTVPAQPTTTRSKVCKLALWTGMGIPGSMDARLSARLYVICVNHHAQTWTGSTTLGTSQVPDLPKHPRLPFTTPAATSGSWVVLDFSNRIKLRYRLSGRGPRGS